MQATHLIDRIEIIQLTFNSGNLSRWNGQSWALTDYALEEKGKQNDWASQKTLGCLTNCAKNEEGLASSRQEAKNKRKAPMSAEPIIWQCVYTQSIGWPIKMSLKQWLMSVKSRAVKIDRFSLIIRRGICCFRDWKICAKRRRMFYVAADKSVNLFKVKKTRSRSQSDWA